MTSVGFSPQAGAPSIVLAVLAHQPESWFAETLAGIAAQDYPKLQTVFFITSDSSVDALTTEIRQVLPSAIIRIIEGNPGYGPVMNQVLRIVEGESGFFCIMHDDVELRSDALSKMVEELFRSNAGVVGPKLVQWEDPTLLQHVGLGADCIGEIDTLIEPHERDQGQHDAVRDVFFLPSACILVRADLFRELDGFAPDIPFFGEDLEFCWRAHLSGARVLVVPAAVARHREKFGERNLDLSRPALEARYRVRTVATLSGRLQLPVIMVQLIVTSLVEAVVGVFTGGVRASLAVLRAAAAVVLDAKYIVERRRQVRPYRRIEAYDIHDLQVRGNARFARFLRNRRAAAQQIVMKDRQGGSRLGRGARATTIAASMAAAVFLLGSRGIITGGVSAVGEMLPMRSGSESIGHLLGGYLSDWSSVGFGAVGAQPTAHVLMALGQMLLLGKLALLQTVVVLGAVVAGCLGMASLGAVFANSRARLAGAIVYGAVPLPYLAIAHGRLGVLLCYAATPWMLRYFSNSSAQQSTNQRSQLFARGVLLTGTVAAFVPSFVIVIALVSALWLIGDLLAGTKVRSMMWAALFGMVATLGATVVQVPWLNSMLDDNVWNGLTGSTTSSGDGISIFNLARLDFGRVRLGAVVLGLYLAVAVGLVIVGATRFVWAARSAALVVGAGAVIVAAGHGLLGISTPEPAVLLVIVAAGLAIASGNCVAAVTDDLNRDVFGWRQPLGWVVVISILVSILPTFVNAANGRWQQPKTSLAQLLVQLPTDPIEGDYNNLYIGDARVLQLPSQSIASYNTNISYAVASDGELTMTSRWRGPRTQMNSSLDMAIAAIVSKSTSLGGRLLAPLAVRYIIVPLIDGGVSSVENPLPVPTHLLDSLSAQLDFQRVYSASDLVIYENAAWLPTLAVLDEATALISSQGGEDALLSSSLGAARALPYATDINEKPLGELFAGTVHLAAPFTANMRLVIGNAEVAPRVAFGGSTAFDLPVGGSAKLVYSTPWLHLLFVFVQLAMWLGLVAISVDARRLRRRWRGSIQRVEVSITEVGA